MRPTVVAGLTVVIALLKASPVASQSPRDSLTGRLLDQVTGAPIRAGVVQLTKTKRRVLTDSLGHFVIAEVPAGTYTLIASALGYRETVGLGSPGVPVVLRVTPEPVPLPAITALTHARERHVRGATLKLFGRAELLAAGDIPMAQFVRWKAPFHTRMCHTLPFYNDFIRGTDRRPEMPAEWMGEECITGPQAGFAPVRVMMDGEPLRYSSELWSHQTWDLGRVEVLYQYMSATNYPFNRPFVLIRMYSLPYLARTAARTSHLCQNIWSADTISDLRLAELCGPSNSSRP